MNSFLKNKNNLFKSGLSKKPPSKVVIGGADLTDLASKEHLLEQKILDAKAKAETEAQRIIEEAQKQANQLIESAKAKQEQVFESAKKEGFDQGYQEAMLQAKEEVKEKLLASEQILDAVEKERRECLEDETDRVYKIVCLIAKKLIKQDLQIDESVSIKFINEAIKKLEYKSEVNVLINPMLAKQINSVKAEIIEASPGLEKITITANENLEPGDLVLESNKERLDLRLDSQLDELIKEIQQ